MRRPDTVAVRPEPFTDLPGLDPSWSRFVTAADAEGVPRRWHLLDTYAPTGVSNKRRDRTQPAAGTMLCVHGNPTWSYLWRRFLSSAPPDWRVIAVDQLGMGLSEMASGTLEAPRHLAQRVEDLWRLTEALDLAGPVVVVGHDWGGPVASGWAVRQQAENPGSPHRCRLAGLVLANTAVHQPRDAALPPLIRLARTPALLQTVCVRTPIFLRGTTALSHPRPPKAIRDAFAIPYPTTATRAAVGQFVADIPFEDDHPTRATLEAIAEGVKNLRVPVLLLRGTSDPVFSEAHLKDLITRLPHADVHRYEGASHLVTEDAPQSAEQVWAWVEARVGDPAPEPTRRPRPATPPTKAVPLWAPLTKRVADPDGLAMVDVARRRRVSFARLEQRVGEFAAGLSALGVQRGQRVALMVPPGIDLTTAVYACWRLGSVIVVADAGLGARNMLRALRGADLDHLVSVSKGLLLARALSIPGRRVLVGPALPGAGPVLGHDATLKEVLALGRLAPQPPDPPSLDTEAAVLFTSGATGPSKGVVYRHDQLLAQVALIKDTYQLTGTDRLVAAFAPFALYGPALGIAAAVPDMKVTAPGTLTAPALADACRSLDATAVFASPAALRNVVATRESLTPDQQQALGAVRLVLSVGAPVAASLLADLQTVLPSASLHTPYGMTEAMPVADITAGGVTTAGPGNGVCVGRPLAGVEVAISPMVVGPSGIMDADLTADLDVTGEVCVSAAHVKERYDRLWATEHASSRTRGWHRTGDVGHLDDAGRLWIEGRRVHVIHTATGLVTPVGLEQAVERLPAVQAAAVVGVGPPGVQQVVVVVVRQRAGAVPGASGEPSTAPLADPELSAAIRSLAEVAVAAVLVAPALPVDIRHQSKVDRAAVAGWADRVLRGEKAGSL